MRFVTWNMQGAKASTENLWNTGVRPFFVQLHADIAGLQECGGVPDSAKLVAAGFGGVAGLDLYRWGTDRAHLFILFYPWDAKGNRCNLALVSLAQPIAARLAWPAAQPSWRPVLLARFSPGGTWYGTLHAISPKGPDVPGLLAATGPVSFVVGDFNREPGSFAVPGWAQCPPNGPTYPTKAPEKRLDYLANTAAYLVEGKVESTAMSDHLPVLFDV